MSLETSPEAILAQYRTLLSASFDRLLDLSSPSAKAKGWVFSSLKHNVLATTRQTPGFLCSRGQGLIPSPPALVFAMVFDVKRLVQWDAMVQQAILIKEFDKDMLLLRIELKGTFPLSPRDLCVLFGYRLYEDGTYVISFRSVVTPLAPEVRGFVRAHLEPSGFVVRPSLGKHCRSSEVDYIVQLDPRGWIPFSVAKMLQNYLPLRIAKVRALCDSRIDADWEREKVEAELCRKEAEEFLSEEKKKLETGVMPQPPSNPGESTSTSSADALASSSAASETLAKEIPSPVKKTKLQQDLLGLTLSPSIPHRGQHPRPVLHLPELEPKEEETSEEKESTEDKPDQPEGRASPEDLVAEAPRSDEIPHLSERPSSVSLPDESASVEELVQRSQYTKALALLKSELDKLEAEAESTSHHVQDLEWSMMHEQNRQSLTISKAQRQPLDRERFKSLLNDYMDQIQRLAERSERVEKQIKQRETSWETRLNVVADKLTRAEKTYDLNKQELRNKKYWKRIWNSIIIVLVFFLWPMIASGLWNYFTPRIERLLRDYVWKFYSRYEYYADEVLPKFLTFFKR